MGEVIRKESPLNWALRVTSPEDRDSPGFRKIKDGLAADAIDTAYEKVLDERASGPKKKNR